MIGTLLAGRYKVINVLKAGGFGQTYVAEDTHRPGYPKCLVKHLKPRSQNQTFLHMARRLFKTEAETLEKLGRHDQIPQLLAYFEENKEFYLVQQYIEGHPLGKEFSGSKRLTEPEVIELLQEVLSILEFVHSHQVIHRDIKPDNLIRRHQDSKLVLIDFGAVKEIRSQWEGELDQTNVTVGIGTQGYMPSEQLAGKPRFCSDLYALGMTAIQALTGLRPNQLPEDPETGEIIWRHKAQVSDGLARVLSNMVRYHFRERYQSTTEVLQALQQFPDAPVIPPPPESKPPAKTRKSFTSAGVFKAIASLALTGLVLGGRHLGWLEPLELATFDQMIRLRYATRVLADLDRNNPLEGQDPRLLIVAITEADIKAQKQWPLTDRTLNQLLDKLERYQPRAIGLDIYRDVPVEPGHAQLIARMQNSKTKGTQQHTSPIIPVCQVGDAKNPGIPPPKGVPIENVGFNDITVDPGGVVRRALLFVDPNSISLYSPCTTPFSFSVQLAQRYLKKEGIQPKVTPEDYLQLGSAVFKPLKPHFGGYQQADSGGYQILLDYHSAHNIAQQVTLTQVLNGQFDPSWVKDRVVLIGVTAPSIRDSFYTPYSEGRPMTGALLHAQMVSQILSVVLDNRPLMWFMPEWMEILWITGWGLFGSIVIWKTRHPMLLVLSVATMPGVVFGTGFWLFIQQGWVPIAAPVLSLIANTASVVVYRLFQNRQQTEVSRETTTAPTSNRQLTLASTVVEDTLPTQTLTFKDNTTAITVQGSLEPNQCQPYLLSCSQGQLLILRAKGNIYIKVVAPDRQPIAKARGTTQWQALLPQAGDYIIEVSSVVASEYTIRFNLAEQDLPLKGTFTQAIPEEISDNSRFRETLMNSENLTKKWLESEDEGLECSSSDNN